MFTKNEIIELLESKDPSQLYLTADHMRKEHKGDKVQLKGIVEFSNICKKTCRYCGISSDIATVMHYRMDHEEIVSLCKNVEGTSIKTIVLQSGEDPYYTKELMGYTIHQIKKSTSLGITLSVGERDTDTFVFWKDMGMDGYILRFETSSEKLFARCHPDTDFKKRAKCIEDLKGLGIATGSGFLIGLPGETIEELADDIRFCNSMELDMIGVAPFIPHPETYFELEENPFDEEMFYKTVAILRIMNPEANIPAAGELALQRGANVFMPNITPQQHNKRYMRYTSEPRMDESDAPCHFQAESRIPSLGRQI